MCFRSWTSALAAIVMLLALGAVAAADSPSAAEITSRIDGYFERAWHEAAVTPSAPATDFVFLRRVYLDLVGHVPPVAVVRQFLADASPTKRADLVSRLLASGEYGRHAATQWRRTWLPQSDSRQLVRQAMEFELWYAEEIDRRTSHDRIVSKLLTVADFADGQPPSSDDLPAPALLIAASDGQPENLTANSMRAFAGLQLDCAQCHDHPFAPWKQDQFWQSAAFFANPRSIRHERDQPANLEIAIPGTERRVAAAFVDGSPVLWPKERASGYGRRTFADWLTRSENPYFARNAVNQLWRQLLGRELVSTLEVASPRDDGHRKLLDELATLFIASGFDLKKLTAAVVLSRPYQAATSPGPSVADSAHFACYALRPLSGEQLYDSLLLAGGFAPEPEHVGAALLSQRQEFAARFPTSAEARPSVSQALTLMNGALVQKITEVQTGRLLSAVAEAPFLDDSARIEALYFATVSRAPSEAERERSLDRIRKATSEADRRAVLADLLWVLVNSSEYRTNH